MNNNDIPKPSDAPSPQGAESTGANDAAAGAEGPTDAELAALEKAADALLNENPEDVGGASPDDVEVLKAELAEANERYVRTQAEMENLRKRTERELVNRSKYAVSKFAESVLSVGDNIQRAIQAVPEDALADNPALTSLLDGIKVTERELHNILERFDVKQLEVEGVQLDPNFHQAMYEISDESVPAGTVLQIVQPGYMIGDRLLRAAQVGVSKGGPKAEAVLQATGAALASLEGNDASALKDAVDAPIEPREPQHGSEVKPDGDIADNAPSHDAANDDGDPPSSDGGNI